MDTRGKILTLDAALQLAPPLTLVTGYFDVLRAGHARELRQVREGAARDGAPAQPLLVVVLPGGRRVLDQRARAELVAALRMVDYVVAANDTDLDRIIEKLAPGKLAARLVRLEAADERRARQLIEHVQRRQTR